MSLLDEIRANEKSGANENNGEKGRSGGSLLDEIRATKIGKTEPETTRELTTEEKKARSTNNRIIKAENVQLPKIQSDIENATPKPSINRDIKGAEILAPKIQRDIENATPKPSINRDIKGAEILYPKTVNDAVNGINDYVYHVNRGMNMENPTYEEARRNQNWKRWFSEDSALGGVVGLATTAAGIDRLTGYDQDQGKEVVNKVTFSRDLIKEAEKLHPQQRNGILDSYAKDSFFVRDAGKMSEGEVEYYSYLLSKYGVEEADKWLNELMPTLRARNMENFVSTMPLVSEIVSRIGNLYGGFVGALGTAVNGVDPNAPYNAILNNAQAVQNINSQNAYNAWASKGKETLGKINQIAYNVAGSAIDSVLSVGVFGGAGGLANQAARAGVQSANDAVIRGADNNQAFAYGVISGIIEAATEKYSLEAMFSDPSNTIGYLLKNVFSEGSEEGASTVLNAVFDRIINQDKSEISQNALRYQNEGLSKKESEKRAFQDWLVGLNQDVLMGMASGLLIGVPAVVSDIGQRVTGKIAEKIAKNIADRNNIIPQSPSVGTNTATTNGNISPNVQTEGAGGAKRSAVADNTMTTAETADTTSESGTLAMSDASTSQRTNRFQWTQAKEMNETVSENDDVPSLTEIVEDLDNTFNLAISQGKVVRGALAHYNQETHAIRTKSTTDIQSISHEVSHYLDQKYGISSSKEMLLELGKFMDWEADFFSGYSDEQVPKEAVAEFIRLFFNDKSKALRMFPGTSKALQTRLSKYDWENLNRIGDKFNRYMTATALERAEASIQTSAEHNRMLRRERRKNPNNKRNRWRAFVAATVDVNDPFRVSGYKAYDRANYALHADTLAGGIVKGDRMVDVNGNDAPMLDFNFQPILDEDGNIQTETSLAQVLAPITENVKNGKEGRERRRAFETLLKCLQSLEMPGMDVYGDPIVDDPKELRNLVKQILLKYPEFAPVSDDLYRWQKSLLFTWAVKPGLIPVELFLELGYKYPHYIPLQRLFASADAIRGKSIGNSNNGEVIHTRKGSKKDTLSMTQGIANNVYHFVRAAEQMATRREIAKFVDNTEGSAVIAERIGKDAKMFKTSTDEIERRFRKAFKELTGHKVGDQTRLVQQKETEGSNGVKEEMTVLTDIDDTIEKAFLEAFGGTYTYFKQVAPSDPRTMVVLNNGVPIYYQVNDDLLLKALNNGFENGGKNTVLKGVRKAQGWFKGLTTGWNIVWSVLRNAPKDFEQGYMKYDVYNPIKYTVSYIKGLIDVVKKSENFYDYKAAGGGYNAYVGRSDTSVDKLFNELYKEEKGTLKGIVWKLQDAVEGFCDAIETIPRLAAYNEAIYRGKSKMQAIADADEATVNFNRHGWLVKDIDAVVPYFNASVQGTYNLFEEVKTNPKKVVIKTLAKSVIMAILVQGWNKLFGGEKDYDDLSNRTKYNNYCFYIGDGKFYKIPKANGWDVVPTLVEQTEDVILNDNEVDAKDVTSYLLNSFLSEPDLFVVSTYLQLKSNTAYNGAPIVSSALEKLPSDEQYDQNTSYLAIGLGRALNWSPKKIDYVINSLGGIVGDVNSAIAPAGLEIAAQNIGNNIIADSAYSTDLSNYIYDSMEELEKKKNSKLHPDFESAYSYNAYSRVADIMSAINKYGRGTDNERACKILANQIAEDFLDTYEPDQRVIGLYERTGEGGLFPYTTFTTEISYDGEKYQVTPAQAADMWDEYNDAISIAYDDIFEAGLDDSETVTALKKAQDEVKNSIKEKWIAINEGDAEEGVPLYTNNAGLSYGEYAVFKTQTGALKSDEEKTGTEKLLEYIDGLDYSEEQKDLLWLDHLSSENREKTVAKYTGCGLDTATALHYYRQYSAIKSDKDKNGNAIDGSKKKKVVALIDSLDVDDEVKYRLYEEAGYSEKGLKKRMCRGSTGRTNKTNGGKAFGRMIKNDENAECDRIQ